MTNEQRRTSRRWPTTPPEIRLERVYSYAVEARGPAVGQPGEDVRAAYVVSTTRAGAIELAKAQLGQEQIGGAAVQWVVRQATELQPDLAAEWLAWHHRTDATEDVTIAELFHSAKYNGVVE